MLEFAHITLHEQLLGATEDILPSGKIPTGNELCNQGSELHVYAPSFTVMECLIRGRPLQ